jgi:C1A family cysteine protease
MSILLQLFVAFSFASSLVSATFVDPNYELKFSQWVRDFRMNFQNDMHRETVLQKWISNHKFIETVNAQNLTYTLGHNQFSGMDSAEFASWVIRGGFESSPFIVRAGESALRRALAALPTSIDWVAKGAVTPVKDQGQCGSCWSFSTTGALEGAYFNKYGKLVSFSEQQLVDCDNLSHGGKDHGCNGGLMDNAFSWIMKNGGLCTESAYPYVSGTTKTAGTCQTSCSNVDGSRATGFVDVAPNSDVAMMNALAMQPVSVAIEADQREFQLYKSGVFTATCGTEAGQDYYKIKNSWSTTWGDGGYIRIGRGSQYNGGKGQCGVLMQASYVNL